MQHPSLDDRISIVILTDIYSYGIFSPATIKGLGYTAKAAQLWSVIPYAVASVVTVIVALCSDRLRLRGPFMLGTLTIGIVGYAVVGQRHASQMRAKYGMMMLMATGLYSSVPPMIVWLTNNSAGHYKRATCTGLRMGVANMGGFIGCKSNMKLGFKQVLTTCSFYLSVRSSSIIFSIPHYCHVPLDLCMVCVCPPSYACVCPKLLFRIVCSSTCFTV